MMPAATLFDAPGDLAAFRAPAAPRSLLRIGDVLPRLGIQRTTLYDWIKAGVMTPSILLGESYHSPAVWPSNEVDAIVNAIVAGQTKAERCATVAALVAARKRAA